MGKRALLVEDELLIALDLQGIIEETGLTVDGPYTDVAGSLEAIGAALPDVAVLDVSLRGGDVFPLADRLHQLGVPILFHSGHADTGSLNRRYPGSAVISKPGSPAQLAARLRELTQQEPHGG